MASSIFIVSGIRNKKSEPEGFAFLHLGQTRSITDYKYSFYPNLSVFTYYQFFADGSISRLNNWKVSSRRYYWDIRIIGCCWYVAFRPVVCIVPVAVVTNPCVGGWCNNYLIIFYFSPSGCSTWASAIGAVVFDTDPHTCST